MHKERLHILKQGADANPPLVFTNPFSYVPHPLCVAAAEEVKHYVENRVEWEEELSRGKMFGVLVVREPNSASLFFLAAFSGQLNGEGDLDYFVPPIFDVTCSTYFQEEMHAIERLADDKVSRKKRSETLQDWLFSQYKCLNAQGEEKSVMDIFVDYYRRHMLKSEHFEKNSSTHHIPSGSGDCCAPKLLQYAYLHGLKPVCMAEFWWGPSPKSEVRHHGQFYPACRGKCKPVLTWMLQGLDVDPNPEETGFPHLIPEIVYEDETMAVLNKPSGLLSVPGRTEDYSVATWAQERWPGALLVHRLDMWTSGIILVSKTKEAYQDMQEQFTSRSVKKKYLAIVEGVPAKEHGVIDLPL